VDHQNLIRIFRILRLERQESCYVFVTRLGPTGVLIGEKADDVRFL
jgi:hypothetical protein